MSELRINANRLLQNIEALAQIGRTPNGAVNRVAFSDSDIKGREFVQKLLREANLGIRVDAAGNIFGRRNGTNPDAPAILLGSHIDTVPDGGAFDGALGVVAAIEVAYTLEENGLTHQHPLELAVWTDEEGALSGSRAFIGELPREELDRTLPAGFTLAKGIERLGGNPGGIEAARCKAGAVAAYLELHVEQGGRLESDDIDIGVVSGIVGIQHFKVTFSGTPNHAGTTPMDQRQNALLAASDFVLAVDRVVRSIPGSQVGTVGELEVLPGAPNVIPGEVQLTVELRDLDSAKIDSLWAMLAPEITTCAASFGCTASTEQTHTMQGTPTDSRIQQVVSTAAETLGLTHLAMPSGAGHDAQNLTRVTPTGMVFVPSVGGVSHSGAEFTRPEDVENGANVLLSSFLQLDCDV